MPQSRWSVLEISAVDPGRRRRKRWQNRPALFIVPWFAVSNPQLQPVAWSFDLVIATPGGLLLAIDLDKDGQRRLVPTEANVAQIRRSSSSRS